MLSNRKSGKCPFLTKIDKNHHHQGWGSSSSPDHPPMPPLPPYLRGNFKILCDCAILVEFGRIIFSQNRDIFIIPKIIPISPPPPLFAAICQNFAISCDFGRIWGWPELTKIGSKSSSPNRTIFPPLPPYLRQIVKILCFCVILVDFGGG